ncbi:MAG: hypothetical protein ABI442_08915 [Gemmatimonadaceae bacterium]
MADVWEATKRSGGLNLLDVRTFVKVADFYNDVSQMLAFYDARTGARRQDVRRLYYYDLEALTNISKRCAADGDSAIMMLNRVRRSQM